jgi:hypothetical protein
MSALTLLRRRGQLPRDDREWLADLLLAELAAIAVGDNPAWAAKATALLGELVEPDRGDYLITGAGRRVLRRLLERERAA